MELTIISNASRFSKSEVKSLIERASGEEAKDHFIDSVWSEISRRQRLYGDAPPFTVENSSVSCVIDWKDKPDYMTCLILSMFGNSIPKETSETGKLFERISNEAVKKYLNMQSVISGYPSDVCIKETIQRMGEEIAFGLPEKAKEAGVDILAWRPFGDGRPSQVVLLVQCASGKNWAGKLDDICLKAWNQYVRWRTDPIKAITVSKIITEEDFGESSNRGGVIFDRARLFRNIVDSCLSTDLKQDLLEWCKAKLQEYSQ